MERSPESESTLSSVMQLGVWLPGEHGSMYGEHAAPIVPCGSRREFAGGTFADRAESTTVLLEPRLGLLTAAEGNAKDVGGHQDARQMPGPIETEAFEQTP